METGDPAARETETTRPAPTLSKSRYMNGRQCAKRLWIELHRRELVPPVDEGTQANFEHPMRP